MKNPKMLSVVIVAALLAALTLGGCSTIRGLMVGELTKGSGSGEAPAQPQPAAAGPSGPAVGSAAWNQAMTMQARMAFNYTFSGGGLWVGQGS